MSKKICKLFLIVCILRSFFMNVCIATENTYTEQVTTVTSVTSLSNLPEANLGLNNILNVILIAIGFLLILFAIAILIRLKK